VALNACLLALEKNEK